MRPPFDVGLLKLQAEFLTDLEKVRIGNGNRIGALKREYKMVPDDVEMMRAVKLAEVLAAAEKTAEADLKRALKSLPIYPWIEGTVGLGDKQMGRLLGLIGDPCWRHDPVSKQDFPRSIGQLWSYCGYAVRDGVAPSRRSGEQAAYNTEARTRTFLIAESCIKHRASPYRAVYDAGRLKYADAVHPQFCKRCGPKGRPAEPGSVLSDGHKHMRAMRLVAKEILRDLWLEAA